MKRDVLLILDDSELDLAILNEIFKRDYKVEPFSTSIRALSYIRENHHRICAMLIDVCLEREDEGFSILQRLKVSPKTSMIPMILIASDAQRTKVLDGIEFGAADFLAKPVNPHYVRERVTQTVAAAWSQPEAEPTAPSQSAPSPQVAPPSPQPPVQVDIAPTAAGPIGSTGPFFMVQEDVDAMANHWVKRLILLSQYRPNLAIGQFRNIQELTALLAEQYVADNPDGILSKADVRMISAASTFYDIGFLGIPDDVLRGGINQPEPGRGIFMKHTDLGREIFNNSDCRHPFLRYCSEIAYWHHKNFDGSGYPYTNGYVELPISAQLVRTALRLTYHVRKNLEFTDYFQRTMQAISAEAGRTISPSMYKTILHAKPQLELLMRVHYDR